MAAATLGMESRLGEGVEAVLKAFRGSSLAAIIMFTDGITTAGDDLPKASPRCVASECAAVPGRRRRRLENAGP